MPASGIIVLEIEASAPQTLSAFATIILEVVSDEETPGLTELAFEEAFYVGAYASPGVLEFNSSIVLANGQSDPSVSFALEGGLYSMYLLHFALHLHKYLN
jgi:hypothetical protein